MYAFEIERPSTVAAAVAALGREGAQALGGGQTLIPSLKQRLAAPAVLVSLAGVGEMKGVCMSDDGLLCIGGGTPHAVVEAEAREKYPALSYLAGHIGDPAVRNRGTVGGSLANNDPAACWPAGVLGTGATVITSNREIAADDFFQGMFTTALEDGEIITEVRFPVPLKAAYVKFVQPASRFALTGVFVTQFADRVRVAVTGASEGGVFRWIDAETALTRAFVAGALEGLTVDADGMIGDLHGTPGYRAHLVKVMTKRAVSTAV